MDPRLQIVILPHYSVVVGYCSPYGEGIRITDCSVVRRWGTSRGLGQLALGGPGPATLDYEGTAVVPHILGVVRTIRCDPDAWAAYPDCARRLQPGLQPGPQA